MLELQSGCQASKSGKLAHSALFPPFSERERRETPRDWGMLFLNCVCKPAAAVWYRTLPGPLVIVSLQACWWLLLSFINIFVMLAYTNLNSFKNQLCHYLFFFFSLSIWCHSFGKFFLYFCQKIILSKFAFFLSKETNIFIFFYIYGLGFV
jgi:hypothetical protein